MNASDPQTWVVFVIVAIAAMYAVYQLAPKTALAGERSIVLWLLKPERWRVLQSVGRKLAPRHRAGSAAGCGTCNTGCDTKNA